MFFLKRALFCSRFLSKKSTSQRPSGISSKSKTLLQVILYLSTFSKKTFGVETCFFLIFRFQDIKQFPTPGNNKKHLFHVKPSGSHFTETLLQTSTPCRLHPGSLYPGISDLCTAPAEGRPNPVQPQPNVRRDKISRSGKTLTLI